MVKPKELTFYSKLDPNVWMVASSARWILLKPKTRSLLLDGLERVARVRADISRSAKVASMPPVVVRCEYWGYAREDEKWFLDGRMYPIRMPNGETQIGAEVPANTIVRDEEFIRRVLVHEFLHCFDYIARLTVQERAGVLFATDEFDNKSKEEDDKRLADPNDWFSEADSAELLHRDDFVDLGDTNVTEVIDAMPMIEPDPRFETRGLHYPDEFAPIIERILAREGAK